jgi:hypothetical protein
MHASHSPCPGMVSLSIFLIGFVDLKQYIPTSKLVTPA